MKQYALKSKTIVQSHLLDGLNEQQRVAADHETGPLLILAGAGSGKTRVMTHRIAHMILNKGVAPESILALTFTNKAAGEMRERVEDLLASSNLGSHPTVSTFHSLCAKLLRREAKHLGLASNFIIYDDKDQMAFIKRMLKDENTKVDVVEARQKRSFIERQKNAALTPQQTHELAFDQEAEDNAFFYESYQKKLRESNCLDFGDLILALIEIFRNQPEVVKKYSTLWQFIMVDEFQDTNPAQMELLNHLISTHKNLAVVGDDDQAIYRWRGATVRNILDFEEQHCDVSVVKLEQNYRSTQTILDAAHNIIQYNTDRKDKKLWTAFDRGEPITLYTSNDDRDEAIYVVNTVEEIVNASKTSYNDIAIFYRTNAQARAFEEQMRFLDVPYQIVGGTSFYAREEIKDILAYLKIALNPKNEVDFFRVLNKPTRGIGKKSEDTLRVAAALHPEGIWGAMASLYDDASAAHEDLFSFTKRAKKNILTFFEIVQTLREMLRDGASLGSVVTQLVDQIDYIAYVNKSDPERAEDKIRNVEELINGMDAFEEEQEDTPDAMLRLQLFLEKSALLASTVSLDHSAGAVTLMTVHSAKGLEFNTVFCVGMEDEVFPSSRSEGDPDAIAEERRLAYVALTRAKEKLYITNARRRRIRGQYFETSLSRFVLDIEEEYVEKDPKSVYRPQRAASIKRNPTQSRPFGYGVDPEEWALDQSPDMYKNSLSKPPSIPDYDELSQVAEYDDELVYEVEDFCAPVNDDVLIGKVVSHSRFGIGEVLSVSGTGDRAVLTIKFPMEVDDTEIIRKWVKVL